MKKLLLIFGVVLLLSTTLTVKVQAAETNATSDSQTEIQYHLPYPGILPDSPWYFFKVVRDSVVRQMVRSQPERSFYEIFLADKRMAAAEGLMVKGKFPLAAVTAMKAEELLINASKDGLKQKNSDLISKLVVSQTKHREILVKLLDKYSSRETAKAWEDNEYVHNRIMNVLLLKK